VYLLLYVFTYLTLFFANLQRKNSNLLLKNKKESSAFGAVFHIFSMYGRHEAVQTHYGGDVEIQSGIPGVMEAHPEDLEDHQGLR
jgi:hypothetical protein